MIMYYSGINSDYKWGIVLDQSYEDGIEMINFSTNGALMVVRTYNRNCLLILNSTNGSTVKFINFTGSYVRE